MVSDGLRARLAARVEECQRIVNARFPDFPQVGCTLFTGRRAAGLAFGYEHRISINEVLLAENPEPMLRDTVAHEFAHVVVWWNYLQQGRAAAPGALTQPRGHGVEWQSTMRELFAVEPSRCHSFDTSNTGSRSQRRWAYRCGCRRHLLTTSKHRRAVAGKRYACLDCNSALACEPEPTVAR
jgi:SprT protein